MNFYTSVSRGARGTLYVRGYQDGKPFKNVIPYKPYLFLESKKRDTGYRTIHGNPVERLDFDSISDANDFLKRYEDVENMKIYGLQDWPYLYIYDHFHKCQYDINKISIAYVDIEVKSDEGFPEPELAEKEVTAITVRKKGKSFVFGCGEYTPKSKDVFYVQCQDEAQLLTRFLALWDSKELNIDVVSGWNVAGFDIPYLYNRICKVLDEEEARKLSPFRQVRDKEVTSKFGKTTFQKILVGIATLDLHDLYRKFPNSPQEKYTLDHIAFVELGEKKLDYSEQESLYALYKNDYEKFIDYNIRDAELCERLEDHKGLIELAITMAYDAGINYVDALTTVKLWDIIIHNHLMDKKTVVPPLKIDEDNNRRISGGHVKDPKTGMYQWVISFDVGSLYPSLMALLNISPETMRQKLMGLDDKTSLAGGLIRYRDWADENNLCLGANGQTHTKEFRGFIPELINERLASRAAFKTVMLTAQQELDIIDAEIKNGNTMNLSRRAEVAARARTAKMRQESLKLGNNSLYGASANKAFRYFNNDMAECITTTGRFAIQWIERDLNQQMNKALGTKDIDFVIAIDTDSVYLNLEEFVKKFKPGADTHEIIDWLDSTCKKLFQPFIDASFKRFSDHLNAYEGILKMKREAIADRGIWTASKHYMLNVWDNEGVRYSEPKVKAIGIETVKSSTPTACKEALKEAIKLILNKTEDDLIEFVTNFERGFDSLSFDEIAFPRGVNGMSKYRDAASLFKKGCPIGPKAALIYNWAIESNGLLGKYPPASDGDKIKFAYLKKLNPLRLPVIGCPGVLPSELNLTRYIDYDLQYEKGFLNPLKSITDVIGWNTEHKSTLESWFS